MIRFIPALIVVLLLAACADSGAALTPVPTATAPVIEPEETPTLVVTDIAPTGTPEGTPVEAVELTAPPSLPVTGQEQPAPACVPHRLASLLAFTVRDSSGEASGRLEGLVVNLPANRMETPPAEGFTPGDPEPTQPDGLAVPVIVYGIIDLDGRGSLGSRDILVPFGLLGFPAPEPAGGFQPVSLAGQADECSLTLTVDRILLAEGPGMENNIWRTGSFGLGRPGWDTRYRRFWSGQGFPVSVEAGLPVILTRGFDSLPVLNFVEHHLGQASDFVLDPQTNQIQYLILSAGGVLGPGERHIAVPIRLVGWGEAGGEEAPWAERIWVDVPAAALADAPSADSLSAFDDPPAEWTGAVEAYWSGLAGDLGR